MFLEKYFKKKRQQKGFEVEDISNGSLESSEARAIREPISEKGIKFARYLVLAVFLILAFRVFYLQVIRGNYYSELSKGNRIREIAIKAPRGLIFDKAGKKLVHNVPSFDLVIIPADLPDDSRERLKEEEELAEILQMNSRSLKAMVESQDRNSFSPVLLKENVSQEEALIFFEKRERFRGFHLDKTAVRKYEDGNCFSFIIGYTGKITKNELKEFPNYLMTDYVGKTGLEYSYEKYLRGRHGKQEVEVDSLGNIKKNFGAKSPINGSDLYLSLDSGLQKKIQDSLERILQDIETNAAAAVAINPQNGEILALASLPSYDNNLFAEGISSEEYNSLITDKDKPMFNRAVSGEYPPGSTFKPLVAAASLQEGIINPGTTVNCLGAISIGKFRFPDWKVHGITDVRKAIAESCDVFFYAVGGGWDNVSGLGIDRMKKYANLFGLGRILGIDIPGEAPGLIPDQSWKMKTFNEKWYIGDDYHCAIGQGFITATPLQLANYAAAIANGGIVYQPHLVRSIKNSNGDEETIKPKILHKNFIAPSNIEIVKEGMRQAVTSSSGSARSLSDLKVAVAGKTGTAQFGSEDKTHGWFISFAPYDNPEIAMAVLVEGGGEGHSTAVPVTKEVYRWYFEEREKD